MMLAKRLFPLATFDDMQREMDCVLSALTPAIGRSYRRVRYPSVNVWEDDAAFHVEAEIPGVDLEDVDVEVLGNELVLKVRRVHASREDECEPTYHRRECAVGEFSRVVTLPDDVDREKIEATLRKGVLAITLPKAERAKARKIKVAVQ